MLRISFSALLLCLVLSAPVSAHFFNDSNEFFWVTFLQWDEVENQKHSHSFNPQKSYDKKPKPTPEEPNPEETPPMPPRSIYKDKDAIRLDDVKGQDEVVAQLRAMIHQFKDSRRLRQLGGRHKKGILLTGPSGTGKTLLAQAVANELGWTFHQASGSSFVEIWVGQGAQRVRQLFEKARREAPAVIFIDEIDAIAAGNRSEASSHGDLEYRQTLNELLCQMNKVEDNDNILIITATNTIEAVDAAFKAPHRSEIVSVNLPSEKGREDILRLYVGRLPTQAITDACIAEVVEKTRNFSGAQLESLVSNAVQIAVADLSATTVGDQHLIQSLNAARNAMKTGMFGSKKTETTKTKFSDIAGMDDIVTEFKDLLFSLKHPEQLRAYGVKQPRGVLLVSKPGCGKTLLVKALANEAECPVFYASGSSFDGKFVGEGAKNIRDLFEKARIVGPAIVFIDELDAINLRQGQHQTLNELLTQMDGFGDSDVIVIGATNMLGEIDPRLRRPNRFSRIIQIDLPNEEQREQILKLYVHKLPRVVDDAQVPYKKLILHTKDFSGAGLQDLVNDAAKLACKDSTTDKVEARHFEEALNQALKTRKLRA